MAIAFDATSAGSAGGTLTIAHTCTGTDLILWVGFFLFKSPTPPGVTSVTYNGVAMTAISGAPSSHQSNITEYLYYLVNPATGTNNIVITPAGSVDEVDANCASYTGATQSGQPDSVGKTQNFAGTTSITLSTTVGVDNSWAVGFARWEGSSPSDGTGTTHRGSFGNGCAIFDSNSALATGSRSLIINFTSSVNSGLIASFSPSAPATSIKTINGLAKSSVKTINSLAIANVKTYNGLA